jgi:hypothetical protein
MSYAFFNICGEYTVENLKYNYWCYKNTASLTTYYLRTFK